MFEIMFWFGVSFIVLSILLGQTVNSSCCYAPVGVFSMTFLFQPLPILLFITFTGGAGLLLVDVFPLLNVFFLWGASLGLSFVASYVLVRWLFTPIFHLENTGSTSNLKIYGKDFILERDISFGQVINHGITTEGTYQNRVISLHEEASGNLKKGTKVYILSIKDNVLLVGDKIG